MTAADIIAAARVCLDTPFRHQGRIPGQALDCAGLIVYVASSLGIPHFDRPGYGRQPAHGILQETLDGQPSLRRCGPDDLQPGDVLLMRFKGDPQHLAIYAGKTIIHSWQAPGKVCEHDLDAIWRSRIVAAYRFNEVSQ